VEKYGCHIIQVRDEGGFPGWSYTIGLGDVLGYPELIVIGLKAPVPFPLKRVRSAAAAGHLFGTGQPGRELLENFECEFRQVEKRWLRQTMGYDER